MSPLTRNVPMGQRRVAGAEWWPVPVDFCQTTTVALRTLCPPAIRALLSVISGPLGILHTLTGLLGLTGNSVLAGDVWDMSAIFP